MKRSTRGWLIALLLGSALVVGLVWAQSQQLTKVATNLGSLGNPFFIRMGQGVTDAAKKINPNVQVIVEAADYDVGKQSAAIDNYIAAGVQILVLNPADPEALVPAVKRAKAAGMTVVSADVGIKEGADAIITSNNVQAGVLACQFIADRLKGNGNVVIINGPPVTAVTDRVAGCKQVFAKYPGIKILSDNQNAGGSRDGGLKVMTDLLTANPKIDAVFAINDPTGIGAELAIRQAKREKEMFITAVDGSPDAVKALKDPNSIFLASSAQDPYTMAARALEIGWQIRTGKMKPQTAPILIPVQLITKQNVNSYRGWE
ncbi:ABC transporter substrate-binding protein [Meiothermus granaticius]|uniref:D-threitol-binding protein n=1 Tax=Meiothermus granaticius NBRC 107808 TaxID=1227551 RepID=A0A399FCJ8_9DEIN|nr:ABC transporter substrate-binding protein [Meiothermus granaticius]MCL6527857.1 ABC transporter substrate-binding protein [Thermaceae bacterium]RIH92411.1 D-threitol-binding protein [Meiothermus granaticius NBRC 107808]GEM87446.1 cytochrome c [Meiothermus granaticius NBRC 107808]